MAIEPIERLNKENMRLIEKNKKLNSLIGTLMVIIAVLSVWSLFAALLLILIYHT